MILKEYPAGPATQGVVRVYRIAHFLLAVADAPAVKLYTPKPEHSLQFFVRQQEVLRYSDGRQLRWRCALNGSHESTTLRLVPRDFLMLQVVFEPEALHLLTGLPGVDLCNQYLDASDLFGAEVLRVSDQLAAAHDYQEMIAVADAFFARLAARRKAVRSLRVPLRRLRDDPAVSVEHLAGASGLSLRQFERLCRERTGLAPKEYSCLARFDRAFNAKLQNPARDWLAIAMDGGYHDYQHMARDFKAFTGYTPPGLIAAHDGAPERLLGVRQQFDLSYAG